MSRVAILIPTKDRSEFFVRQLNYYAELECGQTIYIGDSSGGNHLEQNRQAVQKNAGRVNVVYQDFDASGAYEAELKLAQHINEPYVAVAADDCFLVPRSLDKCADFLDFNPEYTSTYGASISVAVQSDHPAGELMSSVRYPQHPVDEDNARLRFLEFFRESKSPRLAVQRTSDFKDSVEAASQSGDQLFGELLADCVPVMRGKSKELDCLYLARQTYVQPSPPAGVFDWITGPNWLTSYNVFRDGLAEEMMREDQVGEDEAAEVIKQGFWFYLAQGLAMRQPTGQAGGSSSRSRAKNVARLVPGLLWCVRTLRDIRSIKPLPQDKFHLSALLDPSSPYHEDFMPIYQTVMADIGQ